MFGGTGDSGSAPKHKQGSIFGSMSTQSAPQEFSSSRGGGNPRGGFNPRRGRGQRPRQDRSQSSPHMGGMESRNPRDTNSKKKKKNPTDQPKPPSSEGSIFGVQSAMHTPQVSQQIGSRPSARGGFNPRAGSGFGSAQNEAPKQHRPSQYESSSSRGSTRGQHRGSRGTQDFTRGNPRGDFRGDFRGRPRGQSLRGRKRGESQNSEGNQGAPFGMFTGGGYNPRSSNPSLEMVDDQKFQTWNKDQSSSKGDKQKLFDKLQRSTARDFSSSSRSDNSRGGRHSAPKYERGPKSSKMDSQEYYERQMQNPAIQARKKIPCTYFQKGQCRRGDSCHFSHEIAQQPEGGHKTWTKPTQKKKAVSETMSVESSRAKSVEMSLEENKYSNEEEEEKEDEISEDENFPQRKAPSPPKDNPNKGKDLRSMLNKIRQNPPPAPIQSESSEGESEEAYNSDTFGNIRSIKFKSQKSDPKKGALKPTDIANIKEDALSEIDSVGEKAEQDDIEQTSNIQNSKLKLVKKINSDSYSKIIKIIAKSQADIRSGKLPELATEKAQLMRMCELSEIQKRERCRELYTFELDPDDNDLSVVSKECPPKANIEWCIKNYKRSAADIKLDDPLTIRPIPLQVLILDYMLDEIVDSDKMEKTKFYQKKTIHFDEINRFFFDRTRAMRQELTLIGDNTCKGHIQLLEKIARFHCLASNEAIGGEDFSIKQNNEQFTSSLTMLRESYNTVNDILDDPKSSGVSSSEVYRSPFEGEMRAYMILTQMNDTLEVLETLKSLKPDVAQAKEVKYATKIFHAYNNRDVEKYFKLFRNAPYLIACCCVHTIDDMRKRALRILLKGIKDVVEDPDTKKKALKFKLPLELVTEVLCMGNKNEAKEFLETTGYTTYQEPNSKEVDVLYSSPNGKVWKPVRNDKYIESKKVDGQKLHSRGDIIRGVSCRIDNNIPTLKITSRSTSITQKPLTAPVQSLDEKRKIASEARAKGREVLELELKAQMKKKAEQDRIQKEKQQQQQKEIQLKQQKVLEAERKKKLEEERKRKAEEELRLKVLKEKQRKEAERRRKEELERKRIELIKKRQEVTKKNIDKRNREIMLMFFEKFKQYHKKSQQIKHYVKSMFTPYYCRPVTPRRFCFDLLNRPKPSQKLELIDTSDEKFTAGLEKIILPKISGKVPPKGLSTIHYRISLFLSNPELESDSRDNKIFSNWLITSLSDSKKTLKTLLKKVEEGIYTEEVLLFCKNLLLKDKKRKHHTVSYTLNAQYEEKPDLRLSSRTKNQFYLNRTHGTNVIVFVVNSQSSFDCLKILVQSTLEYSYKSLVVYNLSELSHIESSGIQEYLDTKASNTKFIMKICRDIVLSKEEARLAQTVGDRLSYWSRNTICTILKGAKESNLPDYSRVSYSTGIHKVFKENLMLELVSKTMCNEDFSLVDTLIEYGDLEEDKTKEWEELEKYIKCRDLKSFDAKISILQEIIKLTLEDLKAGISNCCVMDPKYFGNFATKIEASFENIPKLLEFLNTSKKDYDLDFFGCPPKGYTETSYNYCKMSKYFEEYLCGLTQKINPDLLDYQVKKMVYDVVGLIVRNYKYPDKKIPGINSKLAFYTLVKIVEKSMALSKYEIIYRRSSDDELPELVKRFDVAEVLHRMRNYGGEDLTPKVYIENLNWKYQLAFSDLRRNPVDKSELNKELKKGEIKKRELKRKAKMEDISPIIKLNATKKYKEEETKTEQKPVSEFKRPRIEKEYDTEELDAIDSYSSDESHTLTDGLDDVIMDKNYL
ncbi:unnamed protein product [Moneuplotes crassus]|uniref:C3H1-type domain-containing protein n=1 Tax=Euplotes crassus TaxID=5936 RepID=A0AAD1Y442_EUPCR|nr:unnamed protein product [Moneuplotes crassus]